MNNTTYPNNFVTFDDLYFHSFDRDLYSTSLK